MQPLNIATSFDLLDIGGDEESDLPGSTCGGSHGPFSVKSVDAGGNVVAPQVVVIGAGISGLRAASVLKNQGVNVIVVEARDRTGGRICTATNGEGKPRELGAAWAHETSQNQLVPLIPKLGIDYYFDDGQPLYYTKNGLEGSQFKAKKVADEFADFCEYYYEKNPNAEDRTGQEFIKEYVQQHPMLSSEERKWAPEAFRECELWQAMSTDYSSTKHMTYFITERNAYVTGGYNRIVDYIAQPLKNDIYLGFQVNEIEHNQDRVVVHCEHNNIKTQFTADAVVVTAPLGVLKKDMIKFSPSLGSQYEEALSKYSYTALGKIFIEFDEVFWSTENDQMIYYPDPDKKKGLDDVLNNCFVLNNLWTVMGAKELCIQTSWPLTEKLESMTGHEVLQYFMPLFELIRTDQTKPLPNCVSVETTKWTQDPFAGYGTYSALAAGDDPYLFWHYLEDHKSSRVQFAGEHCANVGNGCVHGAFQTGDTAARNLLYTLQVFPRGASPTSPLTTSSSSSSEDSD